jgi:hypothetical protein
MIWSDLCTDLLPPQASLHLETLVMTEGGMRLDVAVTASQALCPTCTQPSMHVRSHYRHTLADLPWATTPVQLPLRVRRLWCETPSGARRTFAERVPQVAPCFARATARLSALQTSTGLALGGASEAARRSSPSPATSRSPSTTRHGPARAGLSGPGGSEGPFFGQVSGKLFVLRLEFPS